MPTLLLLLLLLLLLPPLLLTVCESLALRAASRVDRHGTDFGAEQSPDEEEEVGTVTAAPAPAVDVDDDSDEVEEEASPLVESALVDSGPEGGEG